MRISSLALFVLALSACQRREVPTRPLEQYEQQTFASLRSFERPTLQSFGSDKQLLTYLDAVSWVTAHGVDSERAAHLPRRQPKPLEEGGWEIGARPWQHVRSRAHEAPSLPRLARRRDRVFLLRERELLRFVLQDGKLRLDGSHHLAFGRVVWDAVFADAQGLVLIGSCQDVHAIEIVRLDAEQLQRTSSYRVFFRADQSPGYRVRWTDGVLVLFFAHQPSFGDGHYSLPSMQPPDDPAPRALLQTADIVQPLLHSNELRLHTIVRCDTTSKLPDCRARAVAGPLSYHLSLEEDAAYVWLTAWRGEDTPAEGSFLFRLPTNMREPGAVRVRATDGAATVRMRSSKRELHVAASRYDAPLELFSVPHASFTASASSLRSEAYRKVGDLTPGKRTRDDVEIVGESAFWLARSVQEIGHFEYGFSPDAQMVPFADQAASTLALGHAQSWLLPVGRNMLISGSDSWNLHLSLIAPDEGKPRLLARDLVRDAKRSFDHFGPLYALTSAGDRWIAQILYGQSDATLRVLRAGASTLDQVRSWTLPRAAERGEPYGVEAFPLNGDLALLRIDAQLLLIGLSPLAVLQRFTP